MTTISLPAFCGRCATCTAAWMLAQIPAMPGVVASVAVSVGQKVHVGDMLLTIEAMKMETGIHADRAATVKALHVHAGSQIDAKDLLIELE